MTGYIRGGCTALAAKKDFPVFLDETAELFDIISVSAGQEGCRFCSTPKITSASSRRHWVHGENSDRDAQRSAHPDLNSPKSPVQAGANRRLWRTSVHAATFIRQRRIVLDAELLRSDAELRRILIHELFHFVWARLANAVRRSFEELLAQTAPRRVNWAGRPSTARTNSPRTISVCAPGSGGNTAAKPFAIRPPISMLAPRNMRSSLCPCDTGGRELPGSRRIWAAELS